MYWRTHCPRIYRGYTTGPLNWPDVAMCMGAVRGSDQLCVGRTSCAWVTDVYNNSYCRAHTHIQLPVPRTHAHTHIQLPVPRTHLHQIVTHPPAPHPKITQTCQHTPR
jgi:hypothetical protein